MSEKGYLFYRILDEEGNLVDVVKNEFDYDLIKKDKDYFRRLYLEKCSVLVNPNPMSEDEIHNEPTFTKDENKIVKLNEIVLDIDFPFNEYYKKVLKVLMSFIQNPKEKFIKFESYKTASGNIRIYLSVFSTYNFYPEEEHLDITKKLIKIAKVFVHKFNDKLKEELGIEVDRTFLHNIGHFVYPEENPIYLKRSGSSSLEDSNLKHYTTIDDFHRRKQVNFLEEWKEFLDEYYQNVFIKIEPEYERMRPNETTRDTLYSLVKTLVKENL